MSYQNDPQTYSIIGAAMEVHKELGNGFLENVYHKALIKEFIIQKISYQSEVKLPVYYKGEELDCYYQADMICFNDIIVELKALAEITDTHRAQLLNYLKATGLKRGLIVNFGSKSLQYDRKVL